MAQLTSQDRNRENQRRSRQRRQAYIQELEQRVREYERNGVQATAEVQVAARKVADENVRLRSLLGLHGLDGTEVEAYLADDVIPYSTQTKSSQPATERVTGKIVPQTLDGSILQPIGLNPYPTPPAAGQPTDIEARLPVHQRHIDEAKDDRAEGSAPFLVGPSTEPDKPSLVSEAGDETSCEMAAQIIASMRGKQDQERVWSEPGCGQKASAGQTCRAKGVDIFQFMDQG